MVAAASHQSRRTIVAEVALRDVASVALEWDGDNYWYSTADEVRFAARLDGLLVAFDEREAVLEPVDIYGSLAVIDGTLHLIQSHVLLQDQDLSDTERYDVITALRRLMEDRPDVIADGRRIKAHLRGEVIEPVAEVPWVGALLESSIAPPGGRLRVCLDPLAGKLGPRVDADNESMTVERFTITGPTLLPLGDDNVELRIESIRADWIGREGPRDYTIGPVVARFPARLGRPVPVCECNVEFESRAACAEEEEIDERVQEGLAEALAARADWFAGADQATLRAALGLPKVDAPKMAAAELAKEWGTSYAHFVAPWAALSRVQFSIEMAENTGLIEVRPAIQFADDAAPSEHTDTVAWMSPWPHRKVWQTRRLGQAEPVQSR